MTDDDHVARVSSAFSAFAHARDEALKAGLQVEIEFGAPVGASVAGSSEAPVFVGSSELTISRMKREILLTTK